MANIKCLEILLPSFDEKMFLTDILLAPTHGNAQLELRIFLFNSTWKYVLEAYYVSSTVLIPGDMLMAFSYKKYTIH